MYNGLCSEGMDLLKRMLEKDPSKRISASDALSHDFISEIDVEKASFRDGCTLQSLNNIA